MHKYNDDDFYDASIKKQMLCTAHMSKLGNIAILGIPKIKFKITIILSKVR